MAYDTMRMLEKAYDLFDEANQMSSGQLRKKLLRTITNEDFLMALFRPSSTNASKEELNAAITRIYDAASKRSTIASIAEAISDYGFGDMGRASATFLVTLVNLGMANIDEKASDLGRAKDHNEIGDGEYNRQMAKLDRYQEDLQELLKFAKRVVRNQARALSDETGIPRSLCISALFTVPGPEYIDAYKTGFYLKTVLGNVYGYVNANPNETDYEDVDWRTFFKKVFGKDRIPDVASLVLLEGVNKIERYENYHEVRACWDSLTNFALKALNQAPASIRDQMLEIYIKRVNKMLKNHNIDLRVDLRMIDDFRFDKLAETVKRYKSKLDSIMSMINSYDSKPRAESLA